MRPGFSERTFEFCYNAEYCHIHAAVLATHPYIPSQNAEKELGYDVEFKINEGNYTKSVFLQHKVSSYAAGACGSQCPVLRSTGRAVFSFRCRQPSAQRLVRAESNQGKRVLLCSAIPFAP